jgi:gliding motility-associated-like protein
MRYLIFTLIVLSLHGFSFAQTIVGAEYFIDTDPGIGLATALTVTAGATIDETYTVATSTLNPGIHFLYVRVQHINGIWSHYASRVLVIAPDNSATSTVQTIVNAEYFFDTDPGIGLATALTITAGATIDETYTVATNALNPGIHFLYVRVQHINGIWNHYADRIIVVTPDYSTTNISAYEYAFDLDFNPKNGTLVPTDTLVQMDYQGTLDVSALPLGAHLLYTRAVSENNRWGFLAVDTVEIIACTPPVMATLPVLQANIGQSSSLDIAGSVVSQMAGDLSLTIISNGTKGTAIATGGTIIDYLPASGTVGVDSIMLDICSACGLCARDTLLINIINEAPQFIPMNFETVRDSVLEINVLSYVSDTNANLDTASLTINEQPVSGALASITAIGKLQINYAGIDFVGSDSLTITICDQLSVCTAQTIYINKPCVSPVMADIPVLEAKIGQSASLDFLNYVLINVEGAISYNIITNGDKGSATIIDTRIDYLPSSGTVGADSIMLDICSACGVCVRDTVLINIINEAPQFVPMNFEAVRDSVLEINVLNYVSDVNNNLDTTTLTINEQPISAAEATSTSLGELLINYLSIDFVGNDSLTITLCDQLALCTSIAVTINTIETTGNNQVIIYNAISAIQDGLNDYLMIKNIDQYPNNRITVYDRWGSMVFRMKGYNNLEQRFIGKRNVNGSGDLPSGTYYYQLNLGNEASPIKGYLILK